MSGHCTTRAILTTWVKKSRIVREHALRHSNLDAVTDEYTVQRENNSRAGGPMRHLNDCPDAAMTLRILYWLHDHRWVSKNGAILLLTSLIHVLDAARGSNAPCDTDAELVFILAPVLREAAAADSDVLRELQLTAEDVLDWVRAEDEVCIRMATARCEYRLVEVVLKALASLYTPKHNKDRAQLRLVTL